MPADKVNEILVVLSGLDHLLASASLNGLISKLIDANNPNQIE